MKIIIRILTIFIAFAFTNSLKAQDCPLERFLQVYQNKNEYKLDRFVVDTTQKSKKEFLDNLRKIDSLTYHSLLDLASLNHAGENYNRLDERDTVEFSFLITDINNDGLKEYFISVSYEGFSHGNYIIKNGSYKRILDSVDYDDLIVVSPKEIWMMSTLDYMGFSRFSELMSREINMYNFEKDKIEKKIKIYLIPDDTTQSSFGGNMLNFTLKKSRNAIFSKNSKFYSDANLSIENPGIFLKGSTGWVLGDSLNAYFAILDTTTHYLNDSLWHSYLKHNDKAYMLCWVPKANVSFEKIGGYSGTYKDITSGEYLQFFEANEQLYVKYFTKKSFEKLLRIDSRNDAEKKINVKFVGSEKIYKLEFIETGTKIICINPDSKTQTFIKQ